jgi:hypothetical protein
VFAIKGLTDKLLGAKQVVDCMGLAVRTIMYFIYQQATLVYVPFIDGRVSVLTIA